MCSAGGLEVGNGYVYYLQTNEWIQWMVRAEPSPASAISFSSCDRFQLARHSSVQINPRLIDIHLNSPLEFTIINSPADQGICQTNRDERRNRKDAMLCRYPIRWSSSGKLSPFVRKCVHSGCRKRWILPSGRGCVGGEGDGDGGGRTGFVLGTRTGTPLLLSSTHIVFLFLYGQEI